MITNTFTGQCQCGHVHYSVQGEAATLFVCHCTECQRQSVSAFGMALWIKHPSVQLHTGAVQEWVRVTPSGRQMACRFCPVCGTRLFHQLLGQTEFMSIKPGTLSETSTLQPVAHVWTASKQGWVEIPPQALQYEGNPPAMGVLLEAWQQAHPR
ncbi:GFA family protein [Curvibacter sp. CHRR-16]|uniref:GFA family protein n=1 Tax=Curvibacter sp. CHRR-16 TaxID=2835872 RepID=UPI001BDAF348|nr:GFA family protein [Curvibacter sp. CHRR-16]MBT0570039.1 GFA family protein [Curvibacter sp. CHRR-16]